MLMFFGEWEELIAVNLALATTLTILEFGHFMRYRSSMSVSYDNLELLHPDRRVELLEDIGKHIGIMPVQVTIRRVNVKNQSARLRVWYFEGDKST